MKLLLITYYFPPCGGASVQRWLKWLPELVRLGHEITVITTLNGDYPVLDESLLKEVPKEVKVLRAPSPSPGKLWKLLFGANSRLPHGNLENSKDSGFLRRAMVWIRVNLIIPDLRRIWNPRAYKAAVEHLRNKPTDLVITTGPPHSTHLIGLKLKTRYRLPWVADWRDPWTGIYYLKLNPPCALSRKINLGLERKVANSADMNIVVSQHLARHLGTAKTTVIYNGYDATKLGTLDDPSPPEQANKYKIKYIGRVTEGQKLFDMLNLIRNTLGDKEYELTLLGTGLNNEQLSQLRGMLGSKLRIVDFIPHNDALKEMADAHLLLLLINYYEGFEGMLTTKLFEYLASGVEILCLGPHGSEAEQLIDTYQAGQCFDLSEAEAVALFISNSYRAWQQNTRTVRSMDISALSSQQQALSLNDVLLGLKKH